MCFFSNRGYSTAYPSPPRTYYLGIGALKGDFKGLLFGYLGPRANLHLGKFGVPGMLAACHAGAVQEPKPLSHHAVLYYIML